MSSPASARPVHNALPGNRPERLWFYGSRATPAGPVFESVLAEMLADGELPRDVQVWAEGMSAWVPAARVVEFGGTSPDAKAAARWGAWRVCEHVGRRAVARAIDVAIGFSIGCACGVLLAETEHWISPWVPAVLGGTLGLLWWVLVEATLVSRFGTTPGKRLCAMRVCTTRQARPEPGVAFRRSVGVWLRGLGAGVPVLLPIAALFALKDLSGAPLAPWDRESGLVVQERDVWRG